MVADRRCRPLKAAQALEARAREGRIRLEPTIRAVDSDILRPWRARRPSKVDLMTHGVGQLFHMTGGVSPDHHP